MASSIISVFGSTTDGETKARYPSRESGDTLTEPFAIPDCCCGCCCWAMRRAVSSRLRRLTWDSDSASSAFSSPIFSSRSCSNFLERILMIRSSSASYALMRSSWRLEELAEDRRRIGGDKDMESWHRARISAACCQMHHPASRLHLS